MSNYTKLTNFASKDSLASGNPLKVIKGTEIDDEFEAIETAVGTKADLASPTFTGTPIAPTAATGTSSTQVATTAFVVNTAGTLASPAFTGTPTAPTAASGTDTTQIATTEFVQSEAVSAVTNHAALRSSSTVYGHAKIYLSGGNLYIVTT
jgi:hypothetical protein